MPQGFYHGFGGVRAGGERGGVGWGHVRNDEGDDKQSHQHRD